MDDREATAVAERQRKQQQMKQIVAQERAAAIAMKQEREAHEAAENRRMRDIIVEQQRVAGDEDTRLKRLKHERAQALAESLRQQMAEKAALEKKETVFKQQEGREMSRAVSQERKEFAEFATGVVKGKEDQGVTMAPAVKRAVQDPAASPPRQQQTKGRSNANSTRHLLG
eukprot:TRINITY_DN2855_c0_g1_i3.p1 TRINITY_DN2855_c0_g1~~TRINITY_DN2855_c0_g1_i3.p1  ORF type:complete len:171 (-),score=71.13 TRINITY_DN2855_c0_g1_i3:90-602(-)